ncbi:hypothetical protein SynRS9915_00037 [Synechococcus sp. RS9915]|nr:hypothetical protein SynRS9915_00037 [Synechococcus sp. RS9915]
MTTAVAATEHEHLCVRGEWLGSVDKISQHQYTCISSPLPS